MKSLTVGLGWDSLCDIDASIIMCDAAGKMIDKVYWGKQISDDHSVIHSGDNLTGEGEGDDETITIHLHQVSSDCVSIWPVVTIYTRDNQFDDVDGAYCRIMET